MDLLVDHRAEVEAHLRRLGWIGEQEPLQVLEVAGAGNMNRTLRARLPGHTLILKQAVPFVARYPQIAAPVHRLDSEAAFYRAINDSPELASHTPALRGEDRDAHLLWLEDLGDAGDLTRCYQGLSASDLGSLLPALMRWLGNLHGLRVSAAAIPDNLDMRSLNHAHIFEIPFAADNGVALTDGLRRRQAQLAAHPAVRHRAADLGELYLGRGAADRHAGAQQALLHGDFYPGSWLLDGAGRVAVIDPEFAFLGPPEFDVGVLRAHLTMSGCDAKTISGVTAHYDAPAGFDAALAQDFAAMEVVRRLLGVAQLPLAADDATRCDWLDEAREVLGR